MPQWHLYYHRAPDGTVFPVSGYEWRGPWQRPPEENWQVFSEIQDIIISTIFFGMNLQCDPDRPPLLFETLVSNGTESWFWRYPTQALAEAGHHKLLALLQALEQRGEDLDRWIDIFEDRDLA